MKRRISCKITLALSFALALALGNIPEAEAYSHAHEGHGTSEQDDRALVATMHGTGEMKMSMEEHGGMSMGGVGMMMRPDMAPPLGVMGGMSPRQGALMMSLQYMHMRMDGNRDGTDDLSTSEVLEDFPVTPTDMNMDMLMGGLMYGFTDDISAMLMIPYIWKSMDHVTRMGAKFETESEGIGDIRLTGGYDIYKTPNHTVKPTFGLSFPTGSIDERDDTPAGADQVLPYPMQNGSGTIDAIPGITYSGRSDDWSWGGQFSAVLRIGDNEEDYTLGNTYSATAWGAYRWTDWASSSLRVIGDIVENIDGDDSRLDASVVPTADPDRRAGRFVSVGLGVNFLVPSGPLRGLGLSVEGILPVYQNLDGPQLERDYSILVGLRKMF